MLADAYLADPTPPLALPPQTASEATQSAPQKTSSPSTNPRALSRAGFAEILTINGSVIAGPISRCPHKRFVEVERDWRLELLHGFAFKTDKDGNGIPMLFDSDTPSFDPGESAPEAKLGVLHYLGTEKPWRNENGAPHRLYLDTRTPLKGEAIPDYLPKGNLRLQQWILDTCLRPYDQDRISYQ